MKKFISVLMLSVLAVFVVSLSSCSKNDDDDFVEGYSGKRENPQPYDFRVNGVFYKILPKGKIVVVTGGDTYYEGDVTIPATVEYEGETYNVEEIADDAFHDCANMRSLSIANSV